MAMFLQQAVLLRELTLHSALSQNLREQKLRKQSSWGWSMITGHPDKSSEAARTLMVQRNAMAHVEIKQGLERLAIVDTM
jgi:hypothetical protein